MSEENKRLDSHGDIQRDCAILAFFIPIRSFSHNAIGCKFKPCHFISLLQSSVRSIQPDPLQFCAQGTVQNEKERRLSSPSWPMYTPAYLPATTDIYAYRDSHRGVPGQEQTVCCFGTQIFQKLVISESNLAYSKLFSSIWADAYSNYLFPHQP